MKMFFFDCNTTCKLVDSPEAWSALVSEIMEGRKLNRVEAITFILNGKHAPQQQINQIQSEGGDYFLGAPGVVSGDVPSFGYRREHQGAFALRGWATTNNVLQELV